MQIALLALQLRTRRLLNAVLLAACACKGDGSSAASAAQTADAELNSPEDAPSGEVSTLAELPALCLLAGADAVQREDSFTGIVFEYYTQTDACQTHALVSAMSEPQIDDWLSYLLNYSHALFGCGLLFDPLPGGVDAFGLANTEAVGLVSPALGADDAALLIDIYLNSCSSELPLTPAQLAQLHERLTAAAQQRVDSNLTAHLSDCN